MRLLKTWMLIAILVKGMSGELLGAVPQFEAAENTGTFGQVANVGAIVASFLPVGEMSKVASVSKGWARGAGAEFKQVVRELKAWKDGGGLIVTVFGAPNADDISNLWRLRDAGQIDFNQLDYRHIVNLFIEYIRINGTDAAELDRISENARTAINAHPNLTRPQKYLLVEVLLPNIPLNDVRLNSKHRSGQCQCEAQHLVDHRAQYEQCQCWVRLSNADLRRLTPRFIARQRSYIVRTVYSIIFCSYEL